MINFPSSRAGLSSMLMFLTALIYFVLPISAACTGQQTWYFQISSKQDGNAPAVDSSSVVTQYLAERGGKIQNITSQCKIYLPIKGQQQCVAWTGSFTIGDACPGTNLAGSKGYGALTVSVSKSPY